MSDLSHPNLQPKAIEAARHICEEAREVLSSLRGGPPAVAQGELAQDFQTLRKVIRSKFLSPFPLSFPLASGATRGDELVSYLENEKVREASFIVISNNSGNAGGLDLTPQGDSSHNNNNNNNHNHNHNNNVKGKLKDGTSTALISPLESRRPVSTGSNFSFTSVSETGGGQTQTQGQNQGQTQGQNQGQNQGQTQGQNQGQLLEQCSDKYLDNAGNLDSENLGPYARPFVAVVMDPRASGPHTLVALRALHRLLKRGSLTQWTCDTARQYRRKEQNCKKAVPSSPLGSPLKAGVRRWSKGNKWGLEKRPVLSTESEGEFLVSLESLMRGVLQCKFEQTDPGADEAVEMAIADLLSLLVSLDAVAVRSESDDLSQYGRLRPATFMDAFHTVFVTGNTFVHSPALCYHFEEVLFGMVAAAFSSKGRRRIRAKSPPSPARLILEFLVQQLLHTPIFNNSGSGGSEAQTAHDATRLLCLRLAGRCLRRGWGDEEHMERRADADSHPPRDCDFDCDDDSEERFLLRIVQDGLCLALLTLGQAFWEDGDVLNNDTGVAGLSLEVLSEICATVSAMWSISFLRCRLIPQFEAIFTGFFQRALSLLSRRPVPLDTAMSMSNLAFDSVAEIVLESLVDILCLHDINIGDGIKDSSVNNDRRAWKCGTLDTLFFTYDCDMNQSDVAAGLISELCKCCSAPSDSDVSERHSIKRRIVPPHLKEICAEALIGSLKRLFIGFENDRERNNDSDETNETNEINENDNQNSIRETKRKKSDMRRGALLFNREGSTAGLKFLMERKVLPTPVTPTDVAKFLRQGIVVGLDKTAVGIYLGEVGKPPTTKKTIFVTESDRFHAQVLTRYCALFFFQHQSLLEGLRMFLSSFRLPGEAQQIDRILQAFADGCSHLCEESADGRLKYFSSDPSKASDAAYLLAFSLIMLNTDLHNDNIRADRKMSLEAFVKNNSNYGKEITEEGKELPWEYLERLYESIKEEELRTEGEGADGVMTLERWKDVLRGTNGGAGFVKQSGIGSQFGNGQSSDSGVIKSLVMESSWPSILRAVGGFWDVSFEVSHPEILQIEGVEVEFKENAENIQNGIDEDNSAHGNGHNLLVSQSARLGTDIVTELLDCCRILQRKDIFQEIFVSVCKSSGLLFYKDDLQSRFSHFSASVQRQSALIVAINTAMENGDFIGVPGWKYVWGMIFELRDLQLLAPEGLLEETDLDLLSHDARREWSLRLLAGVGEENLQENKKRSSVMGLMIDVLGKTLFGENQAQPRRLTPDGESLTPGLVWTAHQKEQLVLWNYDIEDSPSAAIANHPHNNDPEEYDPYPGTDGAFSQPSQRFKIQQMLAGDCHFAELISETRFFDLQEIQDLLEALTSIIETDDLQVPDDTQPSIPLSPASEAFAEILLCEIALKNRDRIGILWDSNLGAHYRKRLKREGDPIQESHRDNTLVPQRPPNDAAINPGIEKCVTGLMRICSWAVHRECVSDRALSALSLLHPPPSRYRSTFACMDKHLGQGLWRICRNVDALQHSNQDGWDGLLGLADWCASRGGRVVDRCVTQGGLVDDDPSLNAYRSVHLMLTSAELKDVVPFRVVACIRTLIRCGECGGCAKLISAGLGLLHILHDRLGRQPFHTSNSLNTINADHEEEWINHWISILNGMVEAAEKSSFANIRQHALSMISDSIMDRQGDLISGDRLCSILNDTVIPLVAKRIGSILQSDIVIGGWEEVMIELEVCVSLIFKPFLHHLKKISADDKQFILIWKSLLEAVALLLCHEIEYEEEDGTDEIPRGVTMDGLLKTTKELATEHLRNAVMVLITCGILKRNYTKRTDCDLSCLTWKAVENMGFCEDFVDEWKQSAQTTIVQNEDSTGDCQERLNSDECEETVQQEDSLEGCQERHDSVECKHDEDFEDNVHSFEDQGFV